MTSKKLLFCTALFLFTLCGRMPDEAEFSGERWTWRHGATLDNGLRSVIWGGNQFVAVGNIGVVSSPDGKTWTRRSNLSLWVPSIIWTGSRLVVVGRWCAIATSP